MSFVTTPKAEQYGEKGKFQRGPRLRLFIYVAYTLIYAPTNILTLIAEAACWVEAPMPFFKQLCSDTHVARSQMKNDKKKMADYVLF